MKFAASLFGLAALVSVSAATAQNAPVIGPNRSDAPADTKEIWDIPLGTPVAELPRTDFAEPACGTNGGPRSLLIKGFADFAQCRKEAGTGLHEVNFIYDDEREYLARATRDPMLIQAWLANQVLGQPVLLSYLIDDAGLIQGYRVFTDDRAEDSIRHNAFILGQIFFKSRYGEDGWTCTTAEPGPGEKAIGPRFTNDTCVKTTADARVTATSRFYYRAGQSLMDPRTNTIMVGQYISTSSLEVVSLASIKP